MQRSQFGPRTESVVFAAIVLPAAMVCWNCGDPSPVAGGLERYRPLPPSEALASFELADGFRLELAASEPQVTDPVAIAFDEDGRLYVAEMRGYPYDAAPGMNLQGRIRLLVDEDADGVFEVARIFADGLHWPSGIACWRGGIFVTAAPDILYLKDSNGDGRADVRRTVFTGFGTDKSEDIVNNLKWGMDHWIYGTTSYNGGTVRHAGRLDEDGVPLGSSDFRFDPVREILEPVEGTRGDFGNAFDEWGNRFSSNSGNPVIHAVFPLRFTAEGIGPAQLAQPILEGSRVVYPISRPEPWRIARKLHWERWVDTTREMRAQRFPPTELAYQGYFTGGAGLGIYRGDAYPPEFRGNAFTPEPAGNLVLRTSIEPSGVSFVARRTSEGREFLASTDNWFRPVNMANGPDGCMYLVDMYREVIEDPSAMPDEILEHLHYYSGQDMGRIYRIAPDDFEPKTPPALGAATTAELVESLNDASGWRRSTAHRLLFERQAVEAETTLEAILGASSSPQGRLHALWTLEGLRLLDDQTLAAALLDAHAAVRRAAVQIAAGRLADSAMLRSKVAGMASDGDRSVRFQTALALQAMGRDASPKILASILGKDSGDPWIRAAVFAGARYNSAGLVGELLRDKAFVAHDAAPEALKQLASNVAATGQWDSVHAVAHSATAAPGPAALVFRLATAAGIAEGLERTGRAFTDFLSGRPESEARTAIGESVAAAPTAALDRDLPAKVRIDAISLMAWSPEAEVLGALERLISADEAAGIQLAAIRSLGSRNGPQVGSILAGAWRGYSPAVRREATEAIFNRQERLEPFLDALEEGIAVASQLDPARRDFLQNHPNTMIQDRARTILAAAEESDSADALREYRPAVSGSGSAERGAEVFDRECATCHRLGGMGHDVGPDLRERATSSRGDLLVDIVEPNRSVRSNFVNYRIDTIDGRVLTGILARESPERVVLRRGEGIEDSVARSEIESMRSMGLSLMPEGLEDEIDLAEMADLLDFLQSQARQ